MYVTIAGATAGGKLEPANGSHVISDVGTPANTFTLTGIDTAGGTAQTTGVTATPTPALGHGYINLSVQDADSERLTSLEVYYDKLAIFSTDAIQTMGGRPGSAAERLCPAFTRHRHHRAAVDVAIRFRRRAVSGRVRHPLDEGKDSSNSAAVSDIGSPIDRTDRPHRPPRRPGIFQQGHRAAGAAGRQVLDGLPKDIIYVLSYFPGPKITAWSTTRCRLRHRLRGGLRRRHLLPLGQRALHLWRRRRARL